MDNKLIKKKSNTIVLSDEQIEEALKLAVDGDSIKDIADKILVSHMDFWHYRTHNAVFNQEFDLARQEGLEGLADGLLTIADDLSIDVYRAKLKSDNTKWILSKRKPQIYGDKIDLNVNTNIDISSALNAAKQRVVIEASKLSLSSLDSDAHDVIEVSEKHEPNKK